MCCEMGSPLLGARGWRAGSPVGSTQSKVMCSEAELLEEETNVVGLVGLGSTAIVPIATGIVNNYI